MASRRELLPLLLAAAACTNVQRLPGPLYLPADAAPLEEGSDAGLATQAVVMRHTDTVSVRRAGELGSHPLTFYRKRERLGPGGWVLTRAEGKAEILWPGDASALILLGEGAVELGDPEANEPLVTFHDVTDARLTLTPEDRIRLPGGAELRGDPVLPSGPFLVERLSPEMIRVTNRSKRAALLTYGGEALDLAAGYERDLPILAAGRAAGPDVLEAAGIEVAVDGPLTRLEDPAGASFEARGEARLRALGVEVRLAPGERVTFRGLGDAPPPAGNPPPADAGAAGSPPDDEPGGSPPGGAPR